MKFIKKIIKWFIGLFSKKEKVVVNTAKERQLVDGYPKKVIAITSGKKHVWVETRYGKIRKPIGEVQ